MEELEERLTAAVLGALTNSSVPVAQRQTLAALIVELVDESQAQGIEQIVAAVTSAAELEVLDDVDVERIVDALPTDDILRHFSASRVPQVDERCLVEEAESWHRGTVVAVDAAADVFVCVLDDFGGEYWKRRHELAMDWETADGLDGDQSGTCPMCQRTTKLTAHHLRPRQLHSSLTKKGFSRQELNTCAYICRPCHSAVHRTKSNQELAQSFYTLDLLMEIPAIQVWCRYASRQKV